MEKIEGESPTWRFVFSSGERIELEKGLIRGPEGFREEYLAQFDFDPQISKQEWREYLNKWLSDVEVIAQNNLTESELIREEIEDGIERSTVYSHEDRVQALEAHNGIVLDNRGEKEEIWVPKKMIEKWIDDYEVSLQNLQKHIEPIVNTTDQARFKNKGRKRV